MFQIRIHGRGGQGVVTAAELLSVAAFLEGHHAMAFPSFGSERTGAPVAAFCRIDAQPIRTREPVAEPDCLIIQDATLIRHVDVFAGLRSGDGQSARGGTGRGRIGRGHGATRGDAPGTGGGGAARGGGRVGGGAGDPRGGTTDGVGTRGGYVLINAVRPIAQPEPSVNTVTIPATDLAQRFIGRPVPNAALLGGFAALTGRVRLASVLQAIRERFPEKVAAGNIAAAEAAYALVKAAREEMAHA